MHSPFKLGINPNLLVILQVNAAHCRAAAFRCAPVCCFKNPSCSVWIPHTAALQLRSFVWATASIAALFCHLQLTPVAAHPMSQSSVHGSLQSPSSILCKRRSRPCRQRRGASRVQAAKTADGPSVAIVGVTGAVGQEFLRVKPPPVSNARLHMQATACAVYCMLCLLCTIL